MAGAINCLLKEGNNMKVSLRNITENMILWMENNDK